MPFIIYFYILYSKYIEESDFSFGIFIDYIISGGKKNTGYSSLWKKKFFWNRNLANETLVTQESSILFLNYIYIFTPLIPQLK